MSPERRFGAGLLALGFGQVVLAAGEFATADPDALTGGATAFLGVVSLALGGLILTGRLPLDATGRQRRLLGVIGAASLVGGVGAGFVGLVLLAEHFLL